jgi:hypothetical protein
MPHAGKTEGHGNEGSTLLELINGSGMEVGEGKLRVENSLALVAREIGTRAMPVSLVKTLASKKLKKTNLKDKKEGFGSERHPLQ